LDGDVVVVLGEAAKCVLEMDSVLAESFFHGAEEEHLKVSAVDGELGHCVPGEQAAGFGEDGIAVAVVEVEFLGFDAGLFEGLEEAEVSKNLEDESKRWN
jgi:hypothetical protein